MNERKCLDCGEPLRGRSDQKFCSDACRNSFNNQNLGKSSNYMRKVNRILKKNHTILQELNHDDKTTTYKGLLQKKGFNFTYFTHVYKTRAGKVYYFIYDQGFLALENNIFLLVKKEEL